MSPQPKWRVSAERLAEYSVYYSIVESPGEIGKLWLDLRDARAEIDKLQAAVWDLSALLEDAIRTAGGALSWLGSEFPNAQGGFDRFGGAVPARDDLRHLETDLRAIEHYGKALLARTDKLLPEDE